MPAFELGFDSFAEVRSGNAADHGERLRQVVEEIVLADRVGLDAYGVGEHHRADMAASAPAITLAAAAGVTSRIRLSSAVIVLSSADPVRTFQDPVGTGARLAAVPPVGGRDLGVMLTMVRQSAVS